MSVLLLASSVYAWPPWSLPNPGVAAASFRRQFCQCCWCPRPLWNSIPGSSIFPSQRFPYSLFAYFLLIIWAFPTIVVTSSHDGYLCSTPCIHIELNSLSICFMDVTLLKWPISPTSQDCYINAICRVTGFYASCVVNTTCHAICCTN